MKKQHILLVVALSVACLTACDKERKTSVNHNIIVPPREVVVPDTVIHLVNETDYTDSVAWVGSTYRVRSHRYTGDSLSVIRDANGRKFRDNIVRVTITRPDGSKFFDKAFRKAMFEAFVSDEYASQSVLLGMVYDHSDADNLYFVGSMGNPDELSDDFVSFEVKVSRMGEVSIRKTEVDMLSGVKQDDDDMP